MSRRFAEDTAGWISPERVRSTLVSSIMGSNKNRAVKREGCIKDARALSLELVSVPQI